MNDESARWATGDVGPCRGHGPFLSVDKALLYTPMQAASRDAAFFIGVPHGGLARSRKARGRAPWDEVVANV